ncbi:uncharacterized protein LOC141667478 isoform X2 [Apium graveolens]|uniref:uncharacterized protein LOC141667478 isoform X2 n=1 Tax=Apium graveolens TaxID=4045 RepID=UPI003D7B37AD
MQAYFRQFGVGDDCIPVGDDRSGITITNVTCGPGHGIRGYIEAIREIEMQLQQSASSLGFDDIVVACGRVSCDWALMRHPALRCTSYSVRESNSPAWSVNQCKLPSSRIKISSLQRSSCGACLCMYRISNISQQIASLQELSQLGVAAAHCKFDPVLEIFIKVLRSQEIYRCWMELLFMQKLCTAVDWPTWSLEEVNDKARKQFKGFLAGSLERFPRLELLINQIKLLTANLSRWWEILLKYYCNLQWFIHSVFDKKDMVFEEASSQ